jgi:5-hydroxyisourate hydrolase
VGIARAADLAGGAKAKLDALESGRGHGKLWDNPSKTSADGMNHPVERRELLIGGLAASVLTAAPGPAAAETLDPYRITLHVLDVFSGKPAANVRVDLSVLNGQAYRLIKTVNTTVSGRPAAPVLSGVEIELGEYELMFHVADYYSGRGVPLPNPPFLNKVPVRFAVFELSAYHIPLLLTPWSYSTYRGS